MQPKSILLTRDGPALHPAQQHATEHAAQPVKKRKPKRARTRVAWQEDQVLPGDEGEGGELGAEDSTVTYTQTLTAESSTGLLVQLENAGSVASALVQGISRASTNPAPADEEQKQKELKERKQRRKSSTIATARLLAAQGIHQEALEDEDEDDEDDAAAAKLAAGHHWRLPVFMPHGTWYMRWWYFRMAFALVMAVLDPIHLAFVKTAGLYPYNTFWSVIDYLAMLVFGGDMVMKFFLAYSDPEEGMVKDHKRIAIHYLRKIFWVDLLTTVPIESIVSGALGYHYATDDPKALYLGLIRWLKLGRLYHLFDLFEILDHKMIVSSTALLLIRNFTYMFFSVHWMACVMYFAARAEGQQGQTGHNSWAGSPQAINRFEGKDGWVSYFNSFYFALIIFTGFGDNDFFAQNYIETILVIIYIMSNVILNSYLLGSITFIMVANDERSFEFRKRVEVLSDFTKQKELPEHLHSIMREHLELRYYSEHIQDDRVLWRYPPTIRKKVLRHLYLDCLQKCYLFAKCTPRFLDEVLSTVRMEVFMPDMTILNEGEVVSELFILVHGEVCAARAQSAVGLMHAGTTLQTGGTAGSAILNEMGASALKHSMRRAGTDLTASIAKGYKSPHVNMMAGGGAGMSAMTQDSRKFTGSIMGRLSSLTNSIKTAGSMKGLGSMKGGGSMKGNGSMRGSMKGSMKRNGSQGSMGGSSNFGSMGSFKRSGADDGHVTVYKSTDCVAEVPFFSEAPCLQSFWTSCMVYALILTKAQLDALNEKFPEQVRQMLDNIKEHVEEGFRLCVYTNLANCQDKSRALRRDDSIFGSFNLGEEDHKDLLSEEHAEALHAALAGETSFTMRAMRRPMKGLKEALPPETRHELERWEISRNLVIKHLRRQEQQKVYAFINAAGEADMPTLKRLVDAGVSPSSMDYDCRTALMVAAHEGNDGIVKFLLDKGADAVIQDAFGTTAMYEAVKMGHDHVLEVLKAHGVKLNMEPSRIAGLMVDAVVAGSLQQLERLIKAGGDPNWGDYDARTPMHAAASEGYLAGVEMLVEEGGAAVDVVDRWHATPLDNARDLGAAQLVEYLEPLYEEVRKGTRMSWTQTAWGKHRAAAEQKQDRMRALLASKKA